MSQNKQITLDNLTSALKAVCQNTEVPLLIFRHWAARDYDMAQATPELIREIEESYLEKYHSHEKDKVRAELVARQPIGRLGTPEDVASLVRFLCSREAEFINGAVLPIDGGWTAA